jgi:hypothetical protein
LLPRCAYYALLSVVQMRSQTARASGNTAGDSWSIPTLLHLAVLSNVRLRYTVRGQQVGKVRTPVRAACSKSISLHIARRRINFGMQQHRDGSIGCRHCWYYQPLVVPDSVQRRQPCQLSLQLQLQPSGVETSVCDRGPAGTTTCTAPVSCRHCNLAAIQWAMVEGVACRFRQVRITYLRAGPA